MRLSSPAERTMRSLLKVIKPGNAVCSDDVVLIADMPAPPKPKPVDSPDQDNPEALAPELAQETIEKETVHTAEQEAELLSIRRARENAEEISQKILRRARQERDEMLEKARADAAFLKEQAAKEGRETAYEQMKASIDDCLQQVSSLLDDLQLRQRQFIQKYSDGLSMLAVDIAEKVLNMRIVRDDSEMIELVHQAVSSVKNADWISVEVSDNMQGLIERLETEFAQQAAGGPRVDVMAVDAPVGTCVLHTPEEVIDASVPVQIENVRELFGQIK